MAARFIQSCPFWLVVYCEQVRDVRTAYRWWDKGQLSVLYPHGAPAGLLRALDEFASGFDAGCAEKLRKGRERADRESNHRNSP